MKPEDINQFYESVMGSVSRGVLDIETGIRRLQAAGMDDAAIKLRLLEDLEVGGPIFGPFMRGIEDAMIQSTGQAYTSAQLDQYAAEVLPDLTQDPDLVPYTWVAALVNTCENCVVRHGQVETLGDWKRMGLPRSGFSVCGARCKCQLVPAQLTNRTQLKDPLVRQKKDLRKTGYKSARGLPVKIPSEALKYNTEADRNKILQDAAKDERIRRALRLLGTSNK